MGIEDQEVRPGLIRISHRAQRQARGQEPKGNQQEPNHGAWIEKTT